VPGVFLAPPSRAALHRGYCTIPDPLHQQVFVPITGLLSCHYVRRNCRHRGRASLRTALGDLGDALESLFASRNPTVPVACGVTATGVLVTAAVGAEISIFPLNRRGKVDFPVAKPFIVEGEAFVVRDKCWATESPIPGCEGLVNLTQPCKYSCRTPRSWPRFAPTGTKGVPA